MRVAGRAKQWERGEWVAGLDKMGSVADRRARGRVGASGKYGDGWLTSVVGRGLAEAQRRWQEIGRPYEVANAAERQGDALTCVCPEDAAAQLVEVGQGYAELGATGDPARCQHRLRELGVEALPRRATNQDIAQTLFLSPRTVEKHVARVLTKLGASRKDVRAARSAPG